MFVQLRKLGLFSILIFNITTLTASFNYPPSYYNPNYEYYNSPNNLRQTYNICPEDFYYFDYEPLIYNTEYIEKPTSILGTIDNFLNSINTSKQNLTNKYKRSSKKSKFQSQIDSAIVNNVDGPFWQIFTQSYDKCCPLNRNRLKANQVKNDVALQDQIFNSFSNQTHILFFQSQGMFGIIEFGISGVDSFNPYAVQILSSTGFYLISKREFNGAPTITPIALTILLNAWPLLLIILISNAYAGIFIWFLDRAVKTHQFPKPFTHGTARGMWWSYFVFTATSLAPRINLKTWAIRIFTVIWMMVSLVIVVIFIGMFTSALTIYGMHGESLLEKIVGINKFSTDKFWLESENAVAVEYNSIKDMFRDLDEQKVDYILLDKIYANFYSKLINEKFYVMRQVERKRTFNILLRGFNPEQLSCFQTTSAIFSQLWIKSNLTFNANKIKDTSQYFNITDELMYPHRNAILITAFVILSMIIMIGITWQTTCMRSSPGVSSGAAASISAGGSSGAINRGGPRGGSRRAPPRGRAGFLNNSDGPGLSGMLGDVGDIAGEGGPGALGNILGGRGGGGAGTGPGGAAGSGGAARSIFNQTGLTDNIPSVRSLIPGGFLSANTMNSQLQDRSVKFNPLVHSFYYNNKTDAHDKARWEQALLDHQNNTNNNNETKVSWNPGQQLHQQPWNHYKSNDSGFNDIIKEMPIKSFQANSYDFQAANARNNFSPNYSRISSLQSSPVNTLTRVKCVSPANNTAFFNPHYDYNNTNNSPFKANTINITKVELPFNSTELPSYNSGTNNKFKRLINQQRQGIVLNPPTSSVTNIYNQESNTDENFDQNNSNNYNQSSPSTPPPAFSVQNNSNNNLLTTEIVVKDDPEIPDRSRSESDDANNLSINSKNAATASIISNPTYKELPRNESFYLNEFASVKL